ncbi:MAG: alginate biosynthesis protein, partial [Gammaproteobacteria bacterium]|nr:alginate biosynthesis protein [Gammaproteobacteria bacterium]
MIEASYNELSELFSNATHLEGDVQFQGVVTDTRKECQGSLYIALEGEYFDGH